MYMCIIIRRGREGGRDGREREREREREKEANKCTRTRERGKVKIEHIPTESTQLHKF